MATEEEAAADLPQVWASSISTKKELVPALAEVGLSGCLCNAGVLSLFPPYFLALS